MKSEQARRYYALREQSQGLADTYADLCTLQEIYLQHVLVASREGAPNYEDCVARLQSVREHLHLIEREYPINVISE